MAGPAESTGAVRGGKRRGWGNGTVRGNTSAAFAVMPASFAVIAGGVRGEISPAWAYVLRASLKTQSPSDFWDFVGFIPLAQRQLGR